MTDRSSTAKRRERASSMRFVGEVVFALRDSVAALEEALRPFAKAGELFICTSEIEGYDQGIYMPAAGPEYSISSSDFRRAYFALTEVHQEKNDDAQ